MDNNDPTKYVIKMRKGKPILVDKQILRWRKRRKRAEKAALKKAAPTIVEVTDKRSVLKNIFEE